MKSLSQPSCEYSRVLRQLLIIWCFSKQNILPWEISLNAQGTSLILFALFHSTYFNDFILTILYQHTDGYSPKPPKLKHDRSLFLAYIKSETGVLHWWISLPQVVIQGPRSLFSRCGFQAHHVCLHQASAGDQSRETASGRFSQIHQEVLHITPLYVPMVGTQ